MSLDQEPMNQLITDNIDIWTSTVKTKSASGRGSSKKLELYGVKKLRELILELAVRGKLVPQDPSDEPASVLLERIAAEKAQLVIEKKIKKPKKLELIDTDDYLFDIPPSWNWERLGNIGETNIGLTYSPKDAGDEGIPVLRSANIQKGKIDLSDLVRVQKEVKDSVLVESGDLLICARNGSKALVGKTAQIRSLDEPMAFGAFMAIFRSCINDYIEVFLNSPMYRRNLDGVSTTTINQITQTNLRSTICPIPPMEEQHRIVAKVDELMTLCDQLEQQTEASIEAHQVLVTTLLDTLTNSANAEELMQNWQLVAEHFDTLFTTEQSIDQLKQTILQLAVMGKLVSQDLNDELQPNDLETVVKEQRAISSLTKNTGKVDLDTFDFFSGKLAVPDNWTVQPLAEVVLAVVDCPHSTPKWTDSGKVCVRTTQMTPFSLDLSTSRYVSSDTYQKRIERLKPERGDILYSREGGILGVACRVPSSVELCLGQRMIVIRPSRLITSRFLELVLNSPLINEIARHNTTGGAAPRVNVNVIKGYPIPLPPVEEQNRVIRKVEELIDLCDLLKARLNESQIIKLQLTDAIVEQAV